MSAFPIDIYSEISKHIPQGSWKFWILVCRAFAAMNSREKIDKYSNHYRTLLLKLQEIEFANINWIHVSKNPNITWEFVCEHPDYPWNYFHMTENPNITMDIILSRPEMLLNIVQINKIIGFETKTIRTKYGKIIYKTKNSGNHEGGNFWNFKEISCKSGLTIKFLRKYRDPIWGICWISVAKNSSFTWKDVCKSPYLPWIKKYLSCNPNITPEIMLRNPKYKWVYENNPNMTLDILLSIKDYNLSADLISSLDFITIDDINAYPEINWNFNWLSFNKNISANDIENNMQYPWNYNVLESKNIHQDFIELHMIKTWKQLYTQISRAPCIDINFVKKHIDKEFSWLYLSMNSGIYMQDIINNPELPWEYFSISSNPNLTWTFVVENLDKHWFWNSIWSNTFGK